jgi:hypothetical protein
MDILNLSRQKKRNMVLKKSRKSLNYKLGQTTGHAPFPKPTPYSLFLIP